MVPLGDTLGDIDGTLALADAEGDGDGVSDPL